MSDLGSSLVVLVLFLLISAVAFYVGRELVCWYWKINEGLDLLRSIDRSLRAMASGVKLPVVAMSGAASGSGPGVRQPSSASGLGTEDADTLKCPVCAKPITADENSCGNCQSDLGKQVWPVFLTPERFLYCPRCRGGVTLDQEELRASAFECPRCQRHVQYSIRS